MKKKLILALSLLALSGLAYGEIDGDYAKRDVEVRLGLKKTTTMDVNATGVDIMMFKTKGEHKTYQPVEVSISDGNPGTEQLIYFHVETEVVGDSSEKEVLTTKTVPVEANGLTPVGTANGIQTYALKLDDQGKGKFAFDQTLNIKDPAADIGNSTTFTSTSDLLVGIKQR